MFQVKHEKLTDTSRILKSDFETKACKVESKRMVIQVLEILLADDSDKEEAQ